MSTCPPNVALSNGAAPGGGLSDRARFTLGDAEMLPCPDEAFDVVVCECALGTFPDKRRLRTSSPTC